MSIVTPIPQNTTITAYRGVNWSSDLMDVRRFTDEAERQNYLSPMIVKQWDKCSIQTVGRSIKVEASINEMMSVGYISWINDGLPGESKTFYAWVHEINYINVNTVELVYEVDWIQTYLFDITIGNCHIERQHVMDDALGKYILPENIDCGEMIVANSVHWAPSNNHYCCIIQTLDDANNASLYGKGMLSGINTRAALSPEGLESILSAYNETPERVIAIFMCPDEMFNATVGGIFSRTLGIRHLSSVGGYTPHNWKTMQYPFQFLQVDNYHGSCETFRFEEFTGKTGDNDATFRIEGGPVPKPYMQISPVNYKYGVRRSWDGSVDMVYDQMKIAYEDFPCVPYASDTYKAWVSEFGRSYEINKNAEIVSGVSNFIGDFLRLNLTGMINTASSGFSNYANTLQEKESHQLHSLQMHGSVASSGFNFVQGIIGFRVVEYSAKADVLRRADQFFDRYGYRVDVIGVPFVNGRKYVNYVKCGIAHVDCPNVDAKMAMERALLQGVSFWHTNGIGDPFTDNPVVSTV